MKKEELIKELEKLPNGIEVCIFDWRKNLSCDDGEGSSCGIYNEIEVEFIGKSEIPEDTKPWIGIGFKNEDFDDDGVAC